MQSCMKPSGITGMKMAEFFVNLLFVPQKGGLFLVNIAHTGKAWTAMCFCKVIAPFMVTQVSNVMNILISIL